MSTRRSYRDALTGNRNEFIGSPVMSGGKADASGASTPSREKRINSNKKSSGRKSSGKSGKASKNKSPVVPESPVVPASPVIPASPASQQPAGESFDWEAAYDKALTVGEPELVVPAQPGVEHSSTLIITRSLPVLPEHRSSVVAFVRSISLENLKRRKSASTVPRTMVVKDLKAQFGCARADAEKLLQLSAPIHQRFLAAESDGRTEHHAIAVWCGRILFEDHESYSESDFVHEEVQSPSLSNSFERFSLEDDRMDGASPEHSLPSSPARVSETLPRILLPKHVNPLTVQERPAFVEYVLSLTDDPALLDVNAVGADARQQKRRDRCCDHLKQRFTINDRDAKRLLQISYLVHLRFRAGDNGEACEHVQLAGLAGRVVHENDLLIPKRRVVAETPVPGHRPAKAPPLQSVPQNSNPPSASSSLEQSLANVYAHLRSHLPASQAEATIQAMEQNRISGPAAPLPNAHLAGPRPADPATLGRGYRVGAAVGQLARE